MTLRMEDLKVGDRVRLAPHLVGIYSGSATGTVRYVGEQSITGNRGSFYRTYPVEVEWDDTDYTKSVFYKGLNGEQLYDRMGLTEVEKVDE